MQGKLARCLLVVFCLVLMQGTGCAVLGPHTVAKHPGEFGAVRVLGRRARRRIKVLEQGAHRDAEGRLVARVRWLNTADKPYKAQIRRAFYDEKGMLERRSFMWDLHTFDAGENVIEWTSYTPEAVRYLIEVRGRGSWPF